MTLERSYSCVLLIVCCTQVLALRKPRSQNGPNYNKYNNAWIKLQLNKIFEKKQDRMIS